MRPDVLEGGLKLTNARVGGWYDQQKTWPSADRLMLEGFVYDRISPSDGGVEARLRFWLPQTSYLAQPYTQLAEVYRREGNEQDARRVAIAKQRARRADVNKWWRRWPSQ